MYRTVGIQVCTKTIITTVSPLILLLVFFGPLSACPEDGPVRSAGYSYHRRSAEERKFGFRMHGEVFLDPESQSAKSSRYAVRLCFKHLTYEDSGYVPQYLNVRFYLADPDARYSQFCPRSRSSPSSDEVLEVYKLNYKDPKRPDASASFTGQALVPARSRVAHHNSDGHGWRSEWEMLHEWGDTTIIPEQRKIALVSTFVVPNSAVKDRNRCYLWVRATLYRRAKSDKAWTKVEYPVTLQTKLSLPPGYR